MVRDDDSVHVPEPAVEPEPVPPPFVDPPSLTAESWPLPDYGVANPRFPWLPDEDRSTSRSIGTVTGGYLVNSRPLPLPHPHIQILPRQFERSLQYSSDSMIELVEDAANHVAREYPESTLYVGNFGRQGGGNIPHSVSHNSGRDADIAFFVLDEDGEPTAPPDLLPLDHRGRFVGAEVESNEDAEDGEDEDYSDLVLQFDTPRNWKFIEGLIESDAAELQYIFVSNPLRRMLLEEARRQDADWQTRQIASQVLVQPGGNTLPHDDHFHIRIHCSSSDLAAGCRERGRPGPTYQADRTKVRQTIRRAEELLHDDDPDLRRTAIRRLRILDAPGAHNSFIDKLDDPSPKVRIAAIRALRDHRPAASALDAKIPEESQPEVLAELASVLAELEPDSTSNLIGLLGSDHRIPLHPASSLPLSVPVADALARLEDPAAVPELIAALQEAEPTARVAIAQALRLLTNHRFAINSDLRDDTHHHRVVEQWTDWWDENQDRQRRDWLRDGFHHAGFSIDHLDRRDVWELCRAISADSHLNINAQQVLKEISGQSPGSLQWHPHDASFYWRRWFERRIDDLSLPPIPTELSTADGYTKPP